MRCPECNEARLAFTRKTLTRHEYLSKAPSSNHLNNCSYNYDYASYRQLKQYVEAIDIRKIHDKLESALNLLMKNNSSIDKIVKNQTRGNNPFIIKCTDKNVSVYRTIPRKSLNGWLDKDYEGKIFIFYGTVKLKVEQAGETEYFNLLIHTKKADGTWVHKTKVFRGKFQDELDERKVYDIAILGYLDFSYGNTPTIKLAKNNALLYREAF